MKYRLLFLSIFIFFNVFGQTTYVFDGVGDWTDTTQWENGDYPGETILVGDTVEILGELTIPDGTIVTNNGLVESYSSFSGFPSIAIIGSYVNNGITNFNNAQITVEEAGTIVTNGISQLIVTNNSSLTNEGFIIAFGGTIRLSSLVSSIINDNFLSINEGAVFEVLSGTFENKSDENNSDIVTVNIDGTFNVTSGEVINRGVFRNEETANIYITRTFTNEQSGSLLNSGTVTISDFSSSIVNNGNINNSGVINIEENARINNTNGSVFTIQEGSNVTIFSNGNIINDADDFSVRGELLNNGEIDNNTSIFVAGTGVFENNGVLDSFFGGGVDSYGTVLGINTEHDGDFTNNGILSPGSDSDTTGTYLVDGFLSNYTQTASASLDIDLGGTIAGDNYDQVEVDDDVSLDGVLNVSLVDGFVPAIGDSFTIISQGGNITGVFSAENLPALSIGKIWDEVLYDNSQGVVISVIEDVSLSQEDFVIENLQNKVYPNPFTNTIYVPNGKENMAQVYDFNGKVVLEKPIDHSSIDLSELQSGVYFLRIDSNLFKVIKM